MQEMQEMWVWSLGQDDPLDEKMVTHSSILAWRIPWAVESDGLQPMGLQSQTLLSTQHNNSIVLVSATHQHESAMYTYEDLDSSDILFK